MKLVADLDIPFLFGVLDAHFTTAVYKKGKDISPFDVRDADVLIVRTRTQCNENLLSGSKVKVIATATIGIDHIDTDYCKRAGIQVFSAPGCNSHAVLQWVQAAILKLSSKQNRKLAGLVLGVVGAGSIGKLLIDTGKALNMQVLVNDPPRERVEGTSFFSDLKTISRECDIVSFHVPYTLDGVDKTRHLASEEFFNRLNPNALVINTSRGGVVDERFLLNALKKGLATSAIDVWVNEPTISKELLAFAGIATPHIAGYSLEGKINATRMVVDAVGKYFGFDLSRLTLNTNNIEQNVQLNTSKFTDNQCIDLNKLFDFVYPISKEDLLLREKPESFETIRNSYFHRRENSFFELNCTQEVKNIETVKKLGFTVRNC